MTSISTTATYGLDRWFLNAIDGTTTWSVETFTPGTAPVAGYEGSNYSRIVTAGQTLASAISRIDQRIENVRTFAGQTITVSFWAKAATGTPSISTEFIQLFGSGGSPSSAVSSIIASPAKQAITTSWARYSFVIAIPSISGKTIGTDPNSSSLTLTIYTSAGSNFNARTGNLGIQNNTIEIWGVQAEYGSKATPFQLAGGGSPQAELAMCQRYYYSHVTGNDFSVAAGGYESASALVSTVFFPVTMRTAPALVATSGTNYYMAIAAAGNDLFNSLTIANATTSNAVVFNSSEAAGTAGQALRIKTNNASASIAFNSEL
jgi:hypothetical protein